MMKTIINFNINDTLINLFLKDMYKDIRKIEVIGKKPEWVLRRYSDGVVSIEDEYSFLNKLQRLSDRNWKIPSILNVTSQYIDFKYIRGIRLFNFIIELKYFHLVEHSQQSLYTSELIKEIITEQLLNFQSLIPKLKITDNHFYPVEKKLLSPISLLCGGSSFEYDLDEVRSDLFVIAKYYDSISTSLFRDATLKNVIYDNPLLYRKNFINDSDRRIKIRDMLRSGYFTEKCLYENMYYIDFTSCKYSCPQIDDYIAINLHECVAWIPSSQSFYNRNINDINFLITLFVRYLRFGGRKLSYRIYNSRGHKIRFRFDDEKLYFEKLVEITKKLSDSIGISGNELVRIFNYLRSLCDLNIPKDYISEYYNHSNVKYYSGVFPYD